jgi:DNA-binding transcriptional LysR family regulator
MNLGRLDLNLLLAFEALHDTRSVSRAAERLGVRQPAMSAALARLRLTFSDQLFVRAGGAMQPTPRAERLASGISTALDTLRTTISDAPFVPMATQRNFTIASTDYTTLVIIPDLVASVEREAPGVDLRIIGYDKGDVPDLLDRNEIDLALGVFQSPSPNAVRQFLCPERFVGLARLGHPILKNGKINLSDYAAAGHALVSVKRDAVGEIDIALARYGLTRRIALTLPHMLVLPSILKTSELLAAVPGRMADVIAVRDLQTFEMPLSLSPWRIEMLWNPGSRRDPASAWLRSKIMVAAAKAGGQAPRVE